MAKAETASTRAPRASKPVAQAFLAALGAVPPAQQVAVAKAAEIMIRDELKRRRDKTKATAAKEKSRRPVAPSRRPKETAKTGAVQKRGRGRPRKLQPTTGA